MFYNVYRLQVSVTAFTNYLPPIYTQGNISGQSLAGVIVCCVRVLLKVWDSYYNTQIMMNFLIFITMAVAINFICIIFFLYINHTKFVQDCIVNMEVEKATNNGIVNDCVENQLQLQSTRSKICKNDFKNIWGVINKIRAPILTILRYVYYILL